MDETEAAYRRGFQQGATEVMERVRSRLAPDEAARLWRYVMTELYEWRYDKNLEDRTPPPLSL